jgi:uncharacterized protein involved in exopolysaccharide biosynthesis
MMGNQNWRVDDYTAILRRPWAVVVIAAVVCALAGYLVSYRFPIEKASRSAMPAGHDGARQTSLVNSPSAAVSSPDLAEAKRNLDDRAAKLEAFKHSHGQVSGVNTDLKAQAALKSKLEASRRAAERARDDRAYTQSLLSQQLSGRAGAKLSVAADTKSGESLEVRQLRFQISQYDDQIAGAAREQQRLQKQLDTQQGQQQLDSNAWQQYAELAQDYDSAQKTYTILLARSAAAQPEGDPTGAPADPAALPSEQDPEFPNRHLWFAGAGLAGGLAAGIGLSFWLAMRNKTLRTAHDVQRILQAPLLVSVPWIGQCVSATNRQNPPGQSSANTAKPENDTIEV